MTNRLSSQRENHLRALIQSSPLGLTSRETSILTYISVGSIQRPKAEIIEYLGRFPDLKDAEDLESCIDHLMTTGLLIPQVSGDRAYLSVADDPGSVLFPEDPLAANQYRDATSQTSTGHHHPWEASNLGPHGQADHYATLISSINAARASVDLIVTSSAQESLVDASRVAARRGVRVRILHASPHVATELRGGFEHDRARAAGRVWRDASRDSRNLQIRAILVKDDAYNAGSCLIDGRMMRYTLFFPLQQRGSDGELIEIVTDSGCPDLSIHLLYRAAFERAWDRSLGHFADALRHAVLFALTSAFAIFLAIKFNVWLADQKSGWFHDTFSDSLGTVENLSAAVTAFVIGASFRRHHVASLARGVYQRIH